MTIPIPLNIRIGFRQDEWNWRLLIPYFEYKYKKISPIARRKDCNIPEDCKCPACNAPKPYLYRNNGKGGQIKCKVCDTNFAPQITASHTSTSCAVPTAVIPSSIRKTASTLSSINVKTPNALIISATSKLNTAAICLKPFVDNYDYQASDVKQTAKRSGTVVKRTVEYRGTKCEDMPRKPLGIRFSDHPIVRERGYCALSLPSGEDGFGQSLKMGQETGPLWVLRAKP